MKSFDFYDTLFVRLVAEPRSVFNLVEHMLGLRGFSERRRKAERAVTFRLGASEIKLEDIYAELDLDSDRKQGAMALEQRLEAVLLSPVSENIERVSSRDMIVSDMYLPGQFFQAVISDMLPSDRRPALMISSELGCRKSDGRLWRHIIQSGYRPQLHLGDNWVSDVKRPRQFGITARHYSGANLNRFERHYLADGLSGSIVAGVSRATRLAAKFSGDAERESGRPQVDAFASLFGPVIVSFVEYVLEDTMQRGIGDLFFLARDGQLPYQVAKKFIDQRSLPLRAHYVYGSRRALHMAGYTSPEAAASWLLENTPNLSIATIAARANLPVEVFNEAAAALGIKEMGRAVPQELRGRLIEVLKNRNVAAALAEESGRQWLLANAYYRGVGFLPGTQVALVDVGWNGQMQRSLKSILDRDGLGETPIVGYYLCLSSKTRSGNNDELEGYLHDPDQEDGGCPYDPYRPVIEASLSADHGTTAGFKREGHVVPVFGAPPNPKLREAILRQQETVIRFTELLIRVEAATGYRVKWDRDALRSALLMFLRAPSHGEAHAFASHELDVEQVEKESVPLICPGLTWRSLVRRQSLGLWPEGGAALSARRDVLTFIRIARFVHKLTKRFGLTKFWGGARSS